MHASLRAVVVMWAATLLAATLPGTRVAAAPTVASDQPAVTGRVIVKWREGAATAREHPMSVGQPAALIATIAQRRADAAGTRLGLKLSTGRMLGRRSQVMFSTALGSAELAARLARHPDVEYAIEDQRQTFHYIPADPLFAAGPANGQGPTVGQWYLKKPDATIRSAVNVEGAWDLVAANPSVVVAVLDTGVLADHVDLAGRVLPGWDLVSSRTTANDGGGRDSDASDPGDWITAAENTNPNGAFKDCGARSSSWHGTMVSGVIGAAANNGLGMAGVAAGVRILPVRVLGKCGGSISDIVAGMYWAAGIDQPGLLGSSTPARVLNLSLGGTGSCDPAYREAVAEITGQPFNVVIVAAAGNSSGLPVGRPANCPGVIGVTGLRHAGSKVGFSDLGPEITIAAPGGNCVNTASGTPCLYPILTSSNSGTQGPVANGSIWTDSYKISVGTSFSAPIVAGVVALMLSAQPALTPPEVIAALKRTARPFPTTGADNGSDPTPVPMCQPSDGVTEQLQCYCTTALCGAGMIDAAAAVASVLTGLSATDWAEQLLNFGEARFPEYFPTHSSTLVAAPFRYRYYPSTQAYLGVVVSADPHYRQDGVYVMGGPFGTAPVYVGQVDQFLPAAKAAAAAGRSP